MTKIADIDLQTAHAVRTFLAKVSGQYVFSGAILFGSRARGNRRLDSDADVAVLLRGHRGQVLDTKLALADIAYDVLIRNRCADTTSSRLGRRVGTPRELQ